MLSKKDAFTLPEILIILALSGVIMALTAQTVVTQTQKSTFLCYHLFRDLKTTIGHMASSAYGGSLNSFTCESAANDETEYAKCIEDGKSGTANTNLIDYTTDTGFCRGFAKYMSTASAIKCTASDFFTATTANPYGNITKTSVPNFRMANKISIFLSKKVPHTSAGTPNTYRVITIDVNGNLLPNKGNDDRLSFAVYDNGEVLPIGRPAEDTNFFLAVIKMQNIAPRDAAAKEKALKSVRHPAALIRNSKGNSLSFKEAYCRTYGDSDNDPDYCKSYLSFNEPFTAFGQVKTNWSDPDETPVYPRVKDCYLPKYNADGTARLKYATGDFIADCELTVIKPQIMNILAPNPDVYSSKNNEEDKDEGTDEANQIYKY